MAGIFQDLSHVYHWETGYSAVLCCMPESTVVLVPPVLLMDQAYPKEYGSVESEMVAHASHNHALYNVDGCNIFNRMERTTRSNGNLLELSLYIVATNVGPVHSHHMKVSMQVDIFGEQWSQIQNSSCRTLNVMETGLSNSSHNLLNTASRALK